MPSVDETTVDSLDFETSASIINDAEHILLITHKNPDGDAMGSMLGLGLLLAQAQKQVSFAVDGGTPERFTFMPHAENVSGSVPPDQTFDAVIALDGSAPDILGEAGEVALGLSCPIIVIDHHETNNLYGTANVVSSSFVSASEGVLELAHHMNWEVTPEIAYALMVGIVTDTQAFRVGPITSETFDRASELMSIGVNLREIVERTLSIVPKGQLQLIGLGLSRAKMENHIIWSYLTLEELSRSIERPHLTDELLKDEDAYIAAFFREMHMGGVRVSLRAIPGFDVGQVALHFGGGGHRLAGGFGLDDTPIEKAIERVLPHLREALGKGQPKYL